MNEVKIKENLLGKTGRISATGSHVIDPKKNFFPLEYGNVVHYFCIGCGTTFQLSKTVAEKYLKDSLPETIDEGEYIEGTGCEACTKEMTKFELKKI